MHRERPFFQSLVEFMTEGPIIVMALEREDAIARLREVMGATNPANAAEGTIRKRFAASIERNASTARTRRKRPPSNWPISSPPRSSISSSGPAAQRRNPSLRS